jgi:hypothetical protein
MANGNNAGFINAAGEWQLSGNGQPYPQQGRVQVDTGFNKEGKDFPIYGTNGDVQTFPLEEREDIAEEVIPPDVFDGEGNVLNVNGFDFKTGDEAPMAEANVANTTAFKFEEFDPSNGLDFNEAGVETTATADSTYMGSDMMWGDVMTGISGGLKVAAANRRRTPQQRSQTQSVASQTQALQMLIPNL